jgi:ribose-phosphate pyrophosphokinase
LQAPGCGMFPRALWCLPMNAELTYVTCSGSMHELPLSSYPDTMPLVQQSCGVPERVLLRSRSIAAFVAAMFWLDALAWRAGRFPHLILPFVPGARQDRLNSSGDWLFTAKSIAQMINARSLPSVTVLDPHSDVIAGLLNSCRVVSAASCVNTPAGKYAAVISPDAGAEKRAGTVAAKLGVPLIHAWTSRDVGTGAISGFGIDDGALRAAACTYKSLLLVDDICDGGGTFVGLAKTIEAITPAVDLHLFTTHGIYSRGVGELKKHFSHIYCTDSILDQPGDVIEIPVCGQLLQEAL